MPYPNEFREDVVPVASDREPGATLPQLQLCAAQAVFPGRDGEL
ncbi:hypothetical protein [Streptomyces flaveolus]